MIKYIGQRTFQKSQILSDSFKDMTIEKGIDSPLTKV